MKNTNNSGCVVSAFQKMLSPILHPKRTDPAHTIKMFSKIITPFLTVVFGKVFAFRIPQIKSHKKDFVVHYAGWMTCLSALQSPEKKISMFIVQ